MSKEEKRNFVRSLLCQTVVVKGMNCRVRIDDLFSRSSSAVIVLRKKNGVLLAIGL